MIFAPQLVLIPVASKALTRGHYRLIEGERYSVVRMEAYLRALAALPRGRGGGFKVTPKGARAGRSPVVRALRVPIAIACLTVAAVLYQTAAQLFDLPGRLTAGAADVTIVWALVNVALIAYTVAWARGVQHRRRSHRFPVAVHAAYSAGDGELPSLAGRIEDLSQHGARLTVDDRREPGERLRLVLLLDDGPVELVGTVATVAPNPDGEGYMVGFDFDALDAPVVDAIVAWCFRYPFGPDRGIAPEAVPEPAAREDDRREREYARRRGYSPPRSRPPRPSRRPSRRRASRATTPSPPTRGPELRWSRSRDVAQPGSAPPLGGGGPRFESGRPDASGAGGLRRRPHPPGPGADSRYMPNLGGALGRGPGVAILAAWSLVLVGLAVYGLHVFFGLGVGVQSGTLMDGWLYSALVLAGGLGILARVVLVSEERLAWGLIGAGALAWFAGDLSWMLILAGRDHVPAPSIADGFYLAFYPLVYVGLGLLVRARVRRFHASQWLDGLAAALMVGAVGVAVLLPPILRGQRGEPRGGVATNLALPARGPARPVPGGVARPGSWAGGPSAPSACSPSGASRSPWPTASTCSRSPPAPTGGRADRLLLAPGHGVHGPGRVAADTSGPRRAPRGLERDGAAGRRGRRSDDAARVRPLRARDRAWPVWLAAVGARWSAWRGREPHLPREHRPGVHRRAHRPAQPPPVPRPRGARRSCAPAATASARRC